MKAERFTEKPSKEEIICEWVSEPERVDWTGDRCRNTATELLPPEGSLYGLRLCKWHLLIAKLMEKRCAQCGDCVYDHEADAVDDAEYGIEATDLSLAEAVMEPDEFVYRDLCQYCDHVTNKDE
jgi:hypothetical protein